MLYGGEETTFPCPYCGETISMIFEACAGGQQYIEDCEVCCQPIEVVYQVHDGEIHFVEGRRIS